MSDNSPETRAVLALSFEPSEAGFTYYRWRWSRGVPVTDAEREAYLRLPVLYQRGAWRAAIAGRTTVPPRTFKPVFWKLPATMPIGMTVGALLLRVSLMASGLGDLGAVGGVFRSILGVILTVFAIQIIRAKHVARKAGSSG